MVIDPEALLAHSAWLRRLAASLVADGADDVVQETWLAALRRPPSGAARPWLRKVARNAARLRWRGDTNREARERAAGEPDAASPSPAELLERHELQTLLGRLVGELEEPFRAAILLRFAEGLAPAQIAQRLGVPGGTVRWRIKEGLDRLRVRLDALYRGDRRAWIGALGALVPRGGGGAVVVALAAAVLGAAAVLALVLGPHGSRATPSSSAADVHAPERTARATTPQLAAEDAPAWLAQDGAPKRRVAGRVTRGGAPVAGATVRLVSDAGAAEQTTGADGRFAFGEVAPLAVSIGAIAPGALAQVQHVDLRDPEARAEQLELVLTDCVASLYGRVLDVNGAPIAGARLLREDVIGVTSDASGAYELCMLPTAAAVDQFRLLVRADGYGALALVYPPKGREHHDIVLTPEGAIAGRVTGAGGTPAASARVTVIPDDDFSRGGVELPAPATAFTDATGAFAISGLRAGRYRASAAAEGGASPIAIVEVASGNAADLPLRLAATGSVRGRATAGGAPAAGATISAGASSAVTQADGTFVLARVPAGRAELRVTGYALRAPQSIDVRAGAESVIALDLAPAARLHGIVRERGAPVPNARVDIAGGPSRFEINADANGAYEARGILPGKYWVYADDTRLGAFVTSDFEIAGSDDRTLDIDLANAGRISGAVVDRRGAPVAGAYVRFDLAAPDRYGQIRTEARATTDASGRFTCGGLGAGHYVARVGAPGGAPFAFAEPPAVVEVASAEADVDGVRLVVDPVALSVAGTVTDLRGAPLADIDVRAYPDGDPLDRWTSPPHALTTASGAFRLTDLGDVTYNLDLVAPNGVIRSYAGVHPGATGLTIAIDPRACASPEEPPALATRPPSPVRWDDRLELVGWTMPARVRAGEPFDIAVTYRVLAPFDRAWESFMHVDGPVKRVNLDQEPLGGTCPTSAWKTGETIVDHFRGAAPEPGVYTPLIGFFVVQQGFLNLRVSAAPPGMEVPGDGLRLGAIDVVK